MLRQIMIPTYGAPGKDGAFFTLTRLGVTGSQTERARDAP